MSSAALQVHDFLATIIVKVTIRVPRIHERPAVSTEVTGPIYATPLLTSPAVASLPAEVLETAQRLGVAEYLPRVLKFPSKLFGGFPRLFVNDEPENPGDTHNVP